VGDQTVGIPHRRRKEEHLRICLEEDIESHAPGPSFAQVILPHCASPELNLDEIEMTTRLLGKPLRFPLLISSMTGGTESARQINRNLAGAAQELGVALALGSLRAALEDETLLCTYQVRDLAPDILLCANLGAVQLNYGYGLEQCQRAVDLIGADALILHFNPLQEALQAGGNSDFAGLLEKVAQICRRLAVPVIAKEVGYGISGDIARRLVDAGVAAIDVAGAGGASWSQVEMHRASTDSSRRIAQAFATWGLSTVESLRQVRQSVPQTTMIASGGIRDGVDVAKALALGAHVAGLALPLLKEAVLSQEAVVSRLDEIAQTLRIAMFCTGSRSVEDLRRLEPICCGAHDR